MLYCSFCGKRIYEESAFCSNCGQKVIRVAEPDSKIPEPLETKQEAGKGENVAGINEEAERVPETTPIGPNAEGRNTSTRERIPFAHNRKIIPAIYSKDKSISKYLIEIDGKRIEVVADFGKKPKVELFVEGEPPETVNDQESEVSFEFEGLSSTHTIDIWYSLAAGSTFNVRYKEAGVAIKIDGVPVKNCLSDPLVGIKGGNTGLILFAVALGLRAIFTIVSFLNGSADISVAVVYILLVSVMITFAIMLKSKPKVALYGGLALGLLETVEFIVGTILSIKDAMENYSAGSTPAKFMLGFLIWGSMRIWALHSMWKATRALKRL